MNSGIKLSSRNTSWCCSNAAIKCRLSPLSEACPAARWCGRAWSVGERRLIIMITWLPYLHHILGLKAKGERTVPSVSPAAALCRCTRSWDTWCRRSWGRWRPQTPCPPRWSCWAHRSRTREKKWFIKHKEDFHFSKINKRHHCHHHRSWNNPVCKWADTSAQFTLRKTSEE